MISPTTTPRLRLPLTNIEFPSTLGRLALSTLLPTRPRKTVVARAIGVVMETNSMAPTSMPSRPAVAPTPWATLRTSLFPANSKQLMTNLCTMKGSTGLVTLESRMTGPNWPLPFPTLLLLRVKRLRFGVFDSVDCIF